ncbi:MAG: hypothetical protein GY851_07765 [bacterium]|nr:hypothetical protein [bacterium]
MEEQLDIAPVWSGHPVGFCLLTHNGRQFVAFYNADRQMAVAQRALGSEDWDFVELPSHIGWDSHNYITMAVDDTGHLHLTGNMHCAPLLYFRTTAPGDARTFERVEAMVGRDEDRCTYPVFFRGAANEFMFLYRDGKSGNGVRIYNMYDHEARAWRRFLDTPILSGEGKMNAYPTGAPRKGPDGWFHLAWIWRDTPDCATNHDISYARSRDLVHWETSAGTPLELPITITSGAVVDPVPAGGGAINSNLRMAFDHKARPVLSYHKHDGDGNTQVYNARLEDGSWVIHRMTDWEYRWEFSGGGSIANEMRAGSVTVEPDGSLAQDYWHIEYGSGTWRLDPDTLRPVGKMKRKPTRPGGVGKLESTFPGMRVNWRGDTGSSGQAKVRYMVRWETLGPNRDRAREGDLPEPSMLRLYRFKDKG